MEGYSRLGCTQIKHTRTHTHVCVCVCMYVYTQTHIHTHTHTHTHTHILMYVCMTMYDMYTGAQSEQVAMYKPTHTHIHTYIHTHIHTHRQTHNWSGVRKLADIWKRPVLAVAFTTMLA
jgi:hypothetical protein